MNRLRTPNQRFAGLPGVEGLHFAPRWLDDLPGPEGVGLHGYRTWYHRRSGVGRPTGRPSRCRRQARDGLSREWTGEDFIAYGIRDPVPGAAVMRALAAIVRGAPPLHEVRQAGHFVQRWGNGVVQPALSRRQPARRR